METQRIQDFPKVKKLVSAVMGLNAGGPGAKPLFSATSLDFLSYERDTEE